MNKKEYLDTLRSKLAGLPPEDIEERISFYSEMIDDRIEDGISEEDAVNGIGTVDEVVNTIMSEIPLSKIVKNRVKPKKSMPAWAIVLIIIGFPIWFPLIITILSVVFSIFITVWSLIISFFAVDLSLAVAAIVCFVAIFVYLFAGKFAGALLALGSAMVCGALAVLLFFGCLYMVKGTVFLMKKCVLGIKSLFIGKEG
jgi:uncharacterized membrane protein